MTVAFNVGGLWEFSSWPIAAHLDSETGAGYGSAVGWKAEICLPDPMTSENDPERKLVWYSLERQQPKAAMSIWESFAVLAYLTNSPDAGACELNR